MSRLAVLAVLALVAPSSALAARPCSPAALETEVMCPTCDGQTLDQSQAPAAQRVKAFIRTQCGAGRSEDEVKAMLVSDFGERILAAPPRRGFNLVAWILPVAGLLVGAVAIGIAAWRWTRGRAGEERIVPAAASASANGRAPVDPELERRLDEELARFD